MNDQAIESLFVKRLAKDKGISETEANEIIEAMRETEGEDTTDAMIQSLVTSAETINKFPKEVQSDIAQTVIAGGILKARRLKRPEQTPESFATRMAVIREAMGGGDKGLDPEVKAKMDELQKLVVSLKEDKEAAKVKEIVDAFNEKLTKIEDQMAAGVKPADTKDEIEKLVDDVERVEIRKRLLRKAMGLPEEEAKDEIPAERMASELKRRGWDVKGPSSIEEVEKRIRAEFEEQRKKDRAEIEKKADDKARGIEMLAEFGTSLVSTIMPVFAKGGGEKAMGAIATALQTAAEST